MQGQAKSDKILQLRAETFDRATSATVEVNEENKVSHLLEKAWKELQITEPLSQFEIWFSGQKMDPTVKIKEYHFEGQRSRGAP